jgi:hypothetical protein
LRRELPTSRFWAFDEIHKYRSWRALLKGLYDGRRAGQRILVTGSARLDFYRFGGDSLQGRHLLRLHPFSAELRLARPGAGAPRLGGFPEPYLSGRRSLALVRDYRSRLSARSPLERIQTWNLELLPAAAGGRPRLDQRPREIFRSATGRRRLMRPRRLYAIFRLPPFGAAQIRAVKKEQKHYQFDWSLVPSEPARFENLVASHLLKWVHFEQDARGRDVELRYFRDTDGREVDFVVVEGRLPDSPCRLRGATARRARACGISTPGPTLCPRTFQPSRVRTGVAGPRSGAPRAARGLAGSRVT